MGSTLWLEDEAMLDAVTAISGSGPAYVFYFIEAMQQAAYELGLDEAAGAADWCWTPFSAPANWQKSSNEDVATCCARA